MRFRDLASAAGVGTFALFGACQIISAFAASVVSDGRFRGHSTANQSRFSSVDARHRDFSTANHQQHSSLSASKENVGVASALLVSHNANGSSHSGHFTNYSNPHQVTASQVGAPTDSAFRAYTTIPRAVIGSQATFGNISTTQIDIKSTGHTYLNIAAPPNKQAGIKFIKNDLIKWYIYSSDNPAESEYLNFYNVNSGNIMQLRMDGAVISELTTPTIQGGTTAGSELELKGSSTDTAVLVRNEYVYGNFSGGTVKASSIPMLVSHEQNGSSHINGIYSFSSPLSSNGRSRTAIFKSYTGGAYSDVVMVSANNTGIGAAFPPAATAHIANNTASATRGLIVAQHNAGAQSAQITFRKTRGTFTNNSTVVTGDFLGAFNAQAHDGYQVINPAYFGFLSDAAVVAGSATPSPTETNTAYVGRVPTAIVFATGARQGNAAFSGTRKERLRITSEGKIGIGTTAPTSNLHVIDLPVYGGATLMAAHASAASASHTRGAFFIYSGTGATWGRSIQSVK